MVSAEFISSVAFASPLSVLSSIPVLALSIFSYLLLDYCSVILLFMILRLYGIGGRLLRGVRSLYVGSKACVRVGNEVSEWFPVRVGLRQGCVMSLWLFNLYIDGVVREVNARALGRGLKLVDGNDNEWELNQLLFVDDTVVVADSERKLCQLVTDFGRVCERRKLRVNVGKSKVMRCTRNEDGARLNVLLNGEALEEVDQFKYLGSVIAANGGVEADVHHRVNEGCKVLGALKGVMKNRGLGMNVKKVLYEKVVVPTVMYGSESWGMKVTERQKLNVFEMKCLRSMTGVSRLDRVRNEVVRTTSFYFICLFYLFFFFFFFLILFLLNVLGCTYPLF